MSFQSLFNFLNFSTPCNRPASVKIPVLRRCNVEALEGRALLSISPGVAYPVHTSPRSVVTGDFNNDSRLDLALAINNSGTGSVDVLLGNANGTFPAAQNFPAALGTRSLSAGDFDGDGTLDLVTANTGTTLTAGSLSLLFGNGDGTFQPPINSALGDNPISVAVGDLDDDGDLDIVETTKVYSYTQPPFNVRIYDYFVAVFINDLDTVNHEANLNLESTYYLFSGDGSTTTDSAEIGDINGHPSVAYVQGNSVRVMLGNGTGDFAEPGGLRRGNFASVRQGRRRQ